MANLNKSLADELNQPTSFPTARSNKKKIRKPNRPKSNKTQKNSELGFLKTGFSIWTLL